MALLLSIVEREVRYLRTLIDTSASSTDATLSLYLEIATEMGVYGDTSTRLLVVRHYLSDLYQYFCHLYKQPIDPELAEQVAVVSPSNRQRFIKKLYLYWQRLLDPTLYILSENASDELHQFFAPDHTPERARALRQRIRDLQMLAEALEIIDDDPRITFPQRPIAAEVRYAVG